MGKQFDEISDQHKKFIEEQHMFFTGSAAPTGRVNISPKGMDSLRVMGPNRVVWMNLTGSGNETAGHMLKDTRMTLMWCSFTTKPIILRCYGTAKTYHINDAGWDDLATLFPAHRSARQIYDVSVDLVQTSCGYTVPFMEFQSERDTMQKWVDGKSDEDLREYWRTRNGVTLDGAPTGIPTA